MGHKEPAEGQIPQAALIEKLCAALRHELEAVRSQPVADKVISDGRRLAKLGRSWRYGFKSTQESPGIPSDSPGQLEVGDGTYECRVVSWEGREVVVSVSPDLGPQVGRAKLSVDSSFLIEALIDRLNDTSQHPNPAGRLALGLSAPKPTKGNAHLPGLNPEQNAAVAQSMNSNCTYIWGPPGTGKTRTIGALGAEMLTAARRLLVVSHTNIAVDQAILAIAELAGKERSQTAILRVGQPRDRRLDNSPELLADHHLELRQREIVERREQVKAQLGAIKTEVSEAQLRVDLLDWVDRSTEVMAEIEALLAAALRPATTSGIDPIEAEKLSRADELARKLETYAEEEKKFTDLITRSKRRGRLDLARKAEASLKDFTERARPDLDSQVERFETEYGERLLYVTTSHKFRRAERQSARDQQEAAQLHRQAQNALRAFLRLPQTVGLAVPDPAVASDARELISDLSLEAQEVVGNWTMEDAVAERDRLGSSQQELEAELRATDEELRQIEERLLSEATVIGATLTASFTRKTMISQEFDTIIVDEASMASLPAIWASGLLARNIVLVGDFRQLPPVAIAETPAAKKWLQRDVFALAGHVEAVDRGVIPEAMVALWEQRRMKPEISRVPNALVYSNSLRDGPDVESDEELHGWMQQSSWTDRDLYAIDLGNTGSFANTVKGLSPSRANVLSATVSMALAREVLKPGRTAPGELEPARVLIITPYRPQGDLLQAMIHAEGLDAEVAAGTVHAFQGSEAPIVILDLTAAAPHYRLRLFAADLDETTRRLINVAVTRARRRLYVVGELDWIKRQTGQRTATGELVRHLERFADVRDARELLAQQAEETGAPEQGLAVCGGDSSAAVLDEVVAGAKKQVVLFSPRLTSSQARRFARVASKSSGGARKVAVLAPPSDADGRKARSVLEDKGFEVAEKDHMYERAIIVDERLVALPLGASGAAIDSDLTCWWAGARVAGELDRILEASRLARELNDDGSTCERCSESMLLAEGSHENPGRYWKCPNCQNARSVD